MLLSDKDLLMSLSINAKKISKPEAANVIAKSAINFASTI